MEKTVGVETVVFLEKNILEICTVVEWPEKEGYSNPKYFFGYRPIENFQDLICAITRTSNHKTAWELGFGDVEQLNKCKKYHTSK